DAAVAFAERGAATQFDPTVVACLRADPDKVFHGLDDVGSWGAVLDEEPVLHTLSIPQLDQALAAIGRFVDLKSPCTLGHSEALASLVSGAASRLDLPPKDRLNLQRAALTAGYGRLGVSNRIWDKPGPLTVAEWERVRLVPQLAERMLRQSPTLAPVADRRPASRTPRRLRLPGRHRGRHDHAHREIACRRRRIPGHDRTTTASGRALTSRRRAGATGRGSCGPSRR